MCTTGLLSSSSAATPTPALPATVLLLELPLKFEISFLMPVGGCRAEVGVGVPRFDARDELRGICIETGRLALIFKLAMFRAETECVELPMALREAVEAN